MRGRNPGKLKWLSLEKVHGRLLLFCLLIIYSTVATHAQSPHYLLETFGSRNGLLSPKIYSLKQSVDRQLWIGSELGVSNYNGYSFRNFQYTSANENIGRILAITQDSAKNIWVGGDKGLFLLKNDSFTKIEFKGRPGLAIESLLTDADGNLWVGDIIFLYKVTSAQAKKIADQPTSDISVEPFAGLKERAFCLTLDRLNNVYMASHGGVFQFAPKQNSYKLLWQNPDVNNYVESVAALTPDSIYWNRNDGHPTQLINGKLTTYFDHNFLGRDVFTHNNKIYAVTTRDVSRVKDGVFPVVSFGAVANHAHTALIDEEDNIWIGSWEGLLKYRKTAFTIFTLPFSEHSEVFSFLEQKDGTLLFGGNRGLVYKKQANGIEHLTDIPTLFKNAEVLCIKETQDGAIWAGSGYQGISRYHNKKLSNWKDTGNLKDNNCEELFESGDGKMFACTEFGVTVIDPLATDPMIEHYSFLKKHSRQPELFGCYQSGNNSTWFYGSQGLYKLQNKKLVDDSIANMPVKSLYINKVIADKTGNIWIATQGRGLLKCQLKEGRFVLIKQFDGKTGLPSDNSLSVLSDKNNNIWTGDFMSLSMIKSSDDHIINFNEKDGLLSTYYQTLKLEQQKNGTIWGLTTRGIFSFHPDSIDQNNLPPVILFNYVKSKDNAPVEYSYKNNSIRFQFAAVSLSDPGKIRYAYRLKEADSNWTFTSNQAIDLNSLEPGKYTFELLASNNSNVWTKEPFQYKFIVRPPFWKTAWFRLLMAATLFIIVFVLFKRRIAAIREKAAIKQQMAELEGKALRAQMNPHFIFNSLNAIQKLIVVQDMESSYTYLSKFSKLLRLVLDNSDKNFISLSQELEMNKLYLELESLRFKNSFAYNISLNQQTDADIVLIPSLLLQPFIENAIWHGLMHKEGDKKLLINFTEENNHLVCIIEDNGVGREYSAAIKSQKLGAKHFNSKGTQLSEQRIRLLKEPDNDSSLQFIDMKDENGNAMGTRVIIKIPIQKIK